MPDTAACRSAPPDPSPRLFGVPRWVLRRYEVAVARCWALRLLGRRDNGALWSCNDSGHGGWGACSDHDGAGPFRTMAHGDTRIIPVELQEALYPIRIEEFALRQDCQGYQIVRSLYSLAHGGWLGTGLGKGTFTTTDGQQLIPYLNTDFIYSALAQELGLIGAAAVLLVFMLFVARGMKIALQVDDGFSKLLAAGLTFGFAFQTFIIVGGVLREIPLTGITLPFVSYGGSSVVTNFLLLAGLLLVSNRANARR